MTAEWPDDYAAILAANDERAPMWLRVNTRRTSVDDYAAVLADADIAFTQLDVVPHGLRPGRTDWRTRPAGLR